LASLLLQRYQRLEKKWYEEIYQFVIRNHGHPPFAAFVFMQQKTTITVCIHIQDANSGQEQRHFSKGI
jgi:UDP-N-acetylglucosamine:LPS N-acetylglucosamine transferase